MLQSMELYEVEKKAADEREGLVHWTGLRKLFS